LEKASKLLDRQFTVPGTSFRFGIDPIIGIIPGAGDAVSFLVSAILILSMVRYGASTKLVLLMVGNVTLDALVGSIPVLGVLFDAGFKANTRNLELLKKHYATGRYSGSAKKVLVVAAVSLAVAFTILAILFFWGIAALLSLLFGS
jgi:hypothetical protein